jgi:hypothetical protein
MKKFVLYSAIVLLVIGCKPKTKVGRDERNMAFDGALDFAEVAFFQQNYRKAYLLVSEDCEKTFEEFSSSIDKLHPRGFPTAVRAMEYEPIPGQGKFDIFLNGRNYAGEEFYYRLVMQGTCETNYKVFFLERSAGPYPPSKLRQRLITIAPVIRHKQRAKRNSRCRGI